MSASLMTCEVKRTFSKNTMFIGFFLFLLFLFSNCLLMYFANPLFILSSSIQWNNHMNDKDIMLFLGSCNDSTTALFFKKNNGSKIYCMNLVSLWTPHIQTYLSAYRFSSLMLFFFFFVTGSFMGDSLSLFFFLFGYLIKLFDISH